MGMGVEFRVIKVDGVGVEVGMWVGWGVFSFGGIVLSSISIIEI